MTYFEELMVNLKTRTGLDIRRLTLDLRLFLISIINKSLLVLVCIFNYFWPLAW
ncbi:hypothetical protein V6Z12_A07G211400 [Gossypium hirsutum]